MVKLGQPTVHDKPTIHTYLKPVSLFEEQVFLAFPSTLL